MNEKYILEIIKTIALVILFCLAYFLAFYKFLDNIDEIQNKIKNFFSFRRIKMKTITLIIDGKEIEAQVNEEDLKEVEKEKRRAEVGKNYYRFSSSLCSVIKSEEDNLWFNDACYTTGNYFLTEKECEDAARVVSLWLRLKRFADENNENSVDFNNGDINKYSIYFSFNNRCFEISLNYAYKDAFQIYFDSAETAQKAIDEFHDELLWYFTEYGKDN